MTDRVVVLLIVASLALIALGGLGLSAWLLAAGVDPKSVALIVGPGSAAAGSLGTLLATTASRGKDDQ